MKIIIYCQYVWGIGHLARSLELARGLADHDVILLAGGQEVTLKMPPHVRLVRLPVLYMDREFTTLIPADPGRSVADIKQDRIARLFSLFEREGPDLFIVELFPFGRNVFKFELLPLLKSLREGRFGAVKVACSVRDILVGKKRQQSYEQRVLDILNRYFDLLLIHSDERIQPLEETFGRVAEIEIPVFYTGFVTQPPADADRNALRKTFGAGDDAELIVASVGGGRAGFQLLKSTLQACHILKARRPIVLHAFTGPFISESEYKRLCALSAPDLHVRRFSQRFLSYLRAADLSISLAGYNTSMNLLVTQVPALVFPYAQQYEQVIRVQKIKPYCPIQVLEPDDLQPRVLVERIQNVLDRDSGGKPAFLKLDGSSETARILTQWAQNPSNDNFD